MIDRVEANKPTVNVAKGMVRYVNLTPEMRAAFLEHFGKEDDYTFVEFVESLNEWLNVPHEDRI